MRRTSMQRMARFMAGLGLAGTAALTPLLAGNGDIPIYQATTITQPGRYILTRDITTPLEGIVIRAGGVTLDLNGHTLTSQGANGIVLDIASLPPDPGIVVANGRVVGGLNGIVGINLPAVLPVTVEKVGIIAAAQCLLLLSEARLQVRGSVVRDCGAMGIVMQGSGAGLLDVQDTLITDVGRSGIYAANLAGVTVRATTIQRFGTEPGPFGEAGIDVVSLGKAGLTVLDSVAADGSAQGDGIRVSMGGNTGPIRITGTQISGNLGYGIRLWEGSAHITGNTIVANGIDGIRVDAAGIVTPSMISGNSLLRNGVSGAHVQAGVVRFNGNTVGGNAGDGVRIAGETSLVENNFIEGNGGAGLRFLNGTGHAYRSNFLRGNTGGDVQDDFNNTDAGGNIK